MSSSDIHFFPTPYPDELFYSLLARYIYYTPRQSLEKHKTELFSTRWIHPSLEFASNLTAFCENTGHFFEPEEILMNHTVYPFFSPFITKKRQENALASALGHANTFLSSVGALYLNQERDRVYWCPECAREDLENYGEAYLHRSHFLPGIDICLKHKIRLLEYKPPFSEFSTKNSYQYFRPDPDEPVEIIPALPYEIKLASIARKLLKLPFHQFNLDDITKMIRTLLIKEGLATSKQIFYEKIYERLKEEFPQEFLERNKLRIDDFKKMHWMCKLLKEKIIVTPLECLVLIALVSDSFEEFLSQSQEFQKQIEIFSDFGNCHNSFCDNYNKPGAKRISVQSDYNAAVYRCECGQIYRQFRDSPDHYVIVQLGDLYARNVISLREQKASWAEIARATRFTARAVRNQLKRNNFTPVDCRIEEYQNQLLNEIENNPGITSGEISAKYNSILSYLSKYSPEFLDKLNLPVDLSGLKSGSSPKDLTQKDRFYAQQVEEIARELYELEPVVMVSRKRIVENLEPKITMNRVRVLETTWEKINAFCETRHEFSKRKLILRIENIIRDKPGFEVSFENVRRELHWSVKRFEPYWDDIFTKFTSL